ncbi:MAG: hypothetical protein ABJC90_04120 [Roseobacter sp.]
MAARNFGLQQAAPPEALNRQHRVERLHDQEEANDPVATASFCSRLPAVLHFGPHEAEAAPGTGSDRDHSDTISMQGYSNLNK